MTVSVDQLIRLWDIAYEKGYKDGFEDDAQESYDDAEADYGGTYDEGGLDVELDKYDDVLFSNVFYHFNESEILSL